MKRSTVEITKAPELYETENDIPQDARRELSALLNRRLADAIDLQLQMKQAHWNVKGPNFIGLHELFDKINEAVAGYVDLIAERSVQLGGIAEGTAHIVATRSGWRNTLSPSPKARLMSTPLPRRYRHLAMKSAVRLKRPRNWTTPTPPTCSPRFRGALTNGCGLWRPITKHQYSGGARVTRRPAKMNELRRSRHRNG